MLNKDIIFLPEGTKKLLRGVVNLEKNKKKLSHKSPSALFKDIYL